LDPWILITIQVVIIGPNKTENPSSPYPRAIYKYLLHLFAIASRG
jgi:hypothetical protein